MINYNTCKPSLKAHKLFNLPLTKLKVLQSMCCFLFQIILFWKIIGKMYIEISNKWALYFFLWYQGLITKTNMCWPVDMNYSKWWWTINVWKCIIFYDLIVCFVWKFLDCGLNHLWSLYCITTICASSQPIKTITQKKVGAAPVTHTSRREEGSETILYKHP